MIRKITLLLLVLTVLPVCGKKGPLVLEPVLIPRNIENPQLSQLGENLKVQWDFPKTLADKNNTPLDPENIQKIYIYYSNREIPGEKFRKKSTLLKKLQLQDLIAVPSASTPSSAAALSAAAPGTTGAGDFSYSVILPFSLKELDNKLHFIGVQYFYHKKASPLSPIVSIQSMIPVKAAADLKLNLEKKVIKLSWSKPQTDAAGRPIAAISGYNIYKKIEAEETGKAGEGPTTEPGEPETPTFKKINPNNVLMEYFEDMDTGINGNYSYYISAVVSSRIESIPSQVVSIRVTDIFPPDVPANLVCFKSQDHLFLTWKPVTDSDLAYYKIYRRSAAEEEFQLLADKITSTSYKDTKVKTGTNYYYSVTAVDLKGNESPLSPEVIELF